MTAKKPTSKKPTGKIIMPSQVGDDVLVAICRTLPGATEDVKWGDNLIFSVGEKMFAGFHLPEVDPFSFKTDPLIYASLIERDGIRSAPYLGRYHWVQVTDRQALPIETWQDFLADSHALVAQKLPKKIRRELGLD